MSNEEKTYDPGIGQVAKVYLDWDDAAGKWAISPLALDGYPLDGYEDGPETDIDAQYMTEEDREMLRRAKRASLPNARQLADMLAKALQGSQL